MKWTTRLLFLLALSISGALIAMVSGQRNRTPGSALDAINATIERAEYNSTTLLRSLDRSIQGTRASGDTALQVRALNLRGDLLLKIGAAEAARTDYEEIGLLLGAKDESLLLRLVEADVLAGDPSAGLSHLAALLALNPESSLAHIQSGRLALSSAKEFTDACDTLIAETLAYDEAAAASALVDRLAAQDLLDHHRAGVVSSLRSYFTATDGETLARILMKCDSASLFSREARAAFETSFSYDTHAQGVYEYITLLIRADQSARAIRFGSQIRENPAVAAHHPTTLQLIRAHLQAGDGGGAGTLAAELIQATRDLTPAEYAECCKALLKARRWSGLHNAANRMKDRGTSVDGSIASLYLGLAQEGRKRYANARSMLHKFAVSKIPEPFPGAYYEAWTTLARLDRAADARGPERESIYAALQIDKNGPGASELWTRLAELQRRADYTSPVRAMRSYAEALCRKPRAYDEVYALFQEVGEASIAAQGRDLELIYQDLVQARRSLPSVPLDAYSLLHIARRHAQDGNDLAVVSVGRRLLDNLPHFVPAIDLMIDARLRLGRVRSATDQIVDRIDRVGLDDTSRSFVRRLPLYPAPYKTDQLHRIMRADPAWTGRLEIARRLAKEGRSAEALRTLDRRADAEEASSEAILLGAQIRSDHGQRKQALILLKDIPPSDPDYAFSRLLTVKIASLTGDMDAIDRASAELVQVGVESQLRSLARNLLFDRRIEKAAPVLDALEELSGAQTPWNLEHQVLLHLVQGNVQAARETAATVEAFTRSSIAPLGLVLASTIADQPERLNIEAGYMLDHYPNSTNALGEAILALLAGRADHTRSLLENATRRDGYRPEWILIASGLETLGHELGEHPWTRAELDHARSLLRGEATHPRAPLTALGALLAAQSSHFAPYALERLNDFTAGERTAWDAYLIAKTLRTGGEALRARDALWTWTQADAEYFGPAWRLFEMIERARLGHDDHPLFDALRQAELRSRARSMPTGADPLIVQSFDCYDAGKFRAAGKAARSALELDETNHSAHAALARALGADGDPVVALRHWLNACASAPESHTARYVTGALESVSQALSAPGTGFLPSATSGALEALSSYSPSDPRIPLALARLDLRLDPENPALGVARSFRRLDIFLRKTEDTSLADLHAGTESAWVDFYLEYGPEQCLEFCRSQLKLSPGVLSLWLGELRALRALGQHEAALRAASKVHRMSPSAELYEVVAACLQATGANIKQVDAQLDKAKKLRRGTSLGATLTRTKSLLDIKGERTATQAIEALTQVWKPAETGTFTSDQAEVALLLSEALMKRAAESDSAQARVLLLAISDRANNPYDRSLARALSGICGR